MDRRGFLRLLGGAVAAAVAPTKTYSFLGGILRPRPDFDPWLIKWGETEVLGLYPRYLTIVDVARRPGMADKTAKIVELLEARSKDLDEMMRDIPYLDSPTPDVRPL